ncbi:MAG TPA: tyrosine-type recombinase/integrase [Polyangiales bacterium]|nr:tyrosine-type recombinase/integrase [Polyangiales bacterium]
MLDDYFQRPSRIRALRAGPCGAFLDGFSDQFAAAEFSTKCVRCYVLDAVHLGVWLERRGVPLRDVDDALIDRFVAHLFECRCTDARHAGYRRGPFRVREFLGYLRRIGAVHPPQHRSTPVERLVDAYCEWMRKRRGVLATTLGRRTRVLTEFVAAVGVRPRRYTAAGVRAFILAYVREREPSASNATNAVRSFLRYLVAEGRCGAHLPAAVPRVPSPRLAALPMYLGPDQIEKMIHGCNSNVVGLRDRAMLLLLARLGFRPSDVVRVTLDDLDWRRGRIRVFGKSRREAWLPLPQDAGNAILAYLDRRRAVTDHHHVFLGIYAPFGPLGPKTVTARVEVAMQRAGIDLPRGGAYVLRHSLAMRLLGEDASLDQIGAVLRHRRVETTAIYAKVDLRALGDIAQPWPVVEVRPC